MDVKDARNQLGNMLGYLREAQGETAINADVYLVEHPALAFRLSLEAIRTLIDATKPHESSWPSILAGAEIDVSSVTGVYSLSCPFCHEKISSHRVDMVRAFRDAHVCAPLPRQRYRIQVAGDQTFWLCDDCGAVVHNGIAHDKWHAELLLVAQGMERLRNWGAKLG